MHLIAHRAQIVEVELGQMILSTGPWDDLHQLGSCVKEIL